MTYVPYARRTSVPARCWLCATTEGPLRDDVHVTGHLCPSCWTSQPRGSTAWSRAASTLANRLGLSHQWTHSGLRQAWLQDVARRHHITSWYDTPGGTPVPDTPFGWITPDTVDRARVELEQREAAFNQSRIAPGALHPDDSLT